MKLRLEIAHHRDTWWWGVRGTRGWILLSRVRKLTLCEAIEAARNYARRWGW